MRRGGNHAGLLTCNARATGALAADRQNCNTFYSQRGGSSRPLILASGAQPSRAERNRSR